MTSDLPLDVESRIDEACLRFEEDWQRGARPTLVEFLPTVAENYRAALLAELLKIELHYRRRSGELPTAEEYVATFAGYAPAVLAVFSGTPAGGVLTPTTGETRDEAVGEAASTPFPAIPGYEIVSQLGIGGMGVVYRARQLSLGREVALKVLRRAGGGSEEARFRREAASASQVAHENVVRVFDFGIAQGTPYLTMELVEGGNLSDHLEQAAPTPNAAATLVERLAQAAHAAHLKGVVHRDLKPANVLLAFATDGEPDVGSPTWWQRPHCPKLADFGLAKWADESRETVSGDVLGTPHYMAPEQARGKGKDACPRTDVYALGAILYELLVGKPPFQGRSHEVLCQVINDAPVPPRKRRPDVHADLEAVCLKCLEKSPGRRYDSALELAEDLGRFLRREPTKARPLRTHQRAARWAAAHPLLVAAACLVTLACAAAPFVASRLDPERPRHRLKASLKGGQPYLYEGVGKTPEPFRQVLGDAAPLRPNAGGEGFSVESVNTVLWELTDDPACERYRFSAEVRHDAHSRLSLVGLYFGWRERRPSDTERSGHFLSFCYADRGEMAGNRKKKDPSNVAVETNLFTDPSRFGVARNPIEAKPFLLGHSPGEPSPWRKLSVVVTPDGVVATWQLGEEEPQTVADLEAANLALWLRQHRTILELSEPRYAAAPIDFAPRGGLGIYVRGGKASFRRVRLEPLDGTH